MKKYLFIVVLTYSSLLFGQEFKFDSFTAKFNGNKLEVTDTLQNQVYEQYFSNPVPNSIDLDNDGLDELVVQDSSLISGNNFYTYYIYNTIDSFYLADSIYSGLTEPFETESEEIDGIILVTGNSDFDQFNEDPDYNFSPLNCWKFSDGKIVSANDEIYNLFISENEDIMDYLENLFGGKVNCETSRKALGAIAAVYVNYIHAGEQTAAKQFLKKYYLCLDIDKFKTKLNDLLK